MPVCPQLNMHLKWLSAVSLSCVCAQQQCRCSMLYWMPRHTDWKALQHTHTHTKTRFIVGHDFDLFRSKVEPYFALILSPRESVCVCVFMCNEYKCKWIVNNHKTVNHFENQNWDAAKKSVVIIQFNETKCLDHDHCHKMCACPPFMYAFVVIACAARFVWFCLHYFKVNDSSIISKCNSNVQKWQRKKFDVRTQAHTNI